MNSKQSINNQISRQILAEFRYAMLSKIIFAQYSK